MIDFLRFVGAIGLPFMSLGLGVLVGLSFQPHGEKSKTLPGAFVVVTAALFLMAIQLIARPVIEPIWLQYLLLSVLPALVGLGLLVRPRTRGERENDSD